MKIERIKGTNLVGLAPIDWKLSQGSAAFLREYGDSSKIINFLLGLFYDVSAEDSPVLGDKHKTLLEIWLATDRSSYHLCQSFKVKNAESAKAGWLLENEHGKYEAVLPKQRRLGEYLFGLNSEAFRQGGVVVWPNLCEEDRFCSLTRNLRLGGDEKFSLSKVRSSLTGAQKKVDERAEIMAQIRNEYDELRREWETAYRQQEEKRLLMIELKNLQEQEKILNERIATEVKLQERLAVFAQNPDYRELRQLQGEVTRLEELRLNAGSNLVKLTRDSQVDWSMIENLRKECLEWAKAEEQVKILQERIIKRTASLSKMTNDLESSRYQDLSDDSEQLLQRAEDDRLTAQKELEELTAVKDNINKINENLNYEQEELESFDFWRDITEADENRLAKKEEQLRRWKNSKIAGIVDRVGERVGMGSIEEKLAKRLSLDYQTYQVKNYGELRTKFQNFRQQQQKVAALQNKLIQLREVAGREEKLRRIIANRTEFLNQAFRQVKATNLAGWQKGWQKFCQKKRQLNFELEALQSDSEELKITETSLAACAEQLRKKIGNGDIQTADRDQIVAEVFEAARQLRIREEAERELAEYSQRLEKALGRRRFEHLAEVLEPLAELERESSLSNEERQIRRATITNEKQEIQHHQLSLKKRLGIDPKNVSLSILEKKITKLKQRWSAFENLHNSLQDAQALLEVSWQEWQAKYSEKLEREAEWVLNKIFSRSPQAIYFAYRMAVAQLALGNKTDVPLFFVAEEMQEDQKLWQDIIDYLNLLSRSRQVILLTSDSHIGQKISAAGWSLKN